MLLQYFKDINTSVKRGFVGTNDVYVHSTWLEGEKGIQEARRVFLK